MTLDLEEVRRGHVQPPRHSGYAPSMEGSGRIAVRTRGGRRPAGVGFGGREHHGSYHRGESSGQASRFVRQGRRHPGMEASEEEDSDDTESNGSSDS